MSKEPVTVPIPPNFPDSKRYLPVPDSEKQKSFYHRILQAIQDPFIIHPAQFLLDYPIAFAMMGFAGSLTGFKVLDKRPQIKFCVSAIIGGTLRYICHVLSGVFAFGAWTLDAMYKGEGIFAYRAPASDAMTNFWIYSLAYNSYVFIDILLVIVAGVFLFSSKSFRKEMFIYV